MVSDSTAELDAYLRDHGAAVDPRDRLLVPLVERYVEGRNALKALRDASATETAAKRAMAANQAST